MRILLNSRQHQTFTKGGKTMLWGVLAALLFVINAWHDVLESSKGFLDYFFGGFILAVFGAVAFVFGLLFASIIGLFVKKQWRKTAEAELVNLRSSDGVSGNFFLGTGSIGTQQYYFFYQKVGDGCRPGKVEVNDNVTVYEEKRHNGQLKVYTLGFSNDAWRWFAFCWPSERYEFRIPEGSLKKNFVLL
jgi:hypothetical protein